MEGLMEEFQAQAIEIMAQLLEDGGLRLEDHLRVSDQGIALTKAALQVLGQTGFPRMDAFGEGNDSLEGFGLDRSDGFLHPLSEVTKATEENGLPENCVNLWAFVSFVISAAQGWLEEERDRNVAFSTLSQLVNKAAPTVDLKRLLYRSRYDDKALLWLCNLAYQGLEGKVDLVFGR